MTEREKEAFYRNVGEMIKAARVKKKFNQGAFADALNLSRTSIVNIEKGRQRPALHLLFDIANFTDSSTEDLVPKTITEEKGESEMPQEIIEELNEASPEVRKKVNEWLKKQQAKH